MEENYLVDDALSSTSIHQALQNGVQCDEINHLIDSYPWSCRSSNIHGLLPLHSAIYHNSSDDIIQLLILAYPDACNKSDNLERLPLHYAYKRNSHFNTIKSLILAYPEACWKGDKDQNLPLHIAVMSKCSLKSISLILECYPEACTITNSASQLPLHLAIKFNAAPEVISSLISHYTDSLLTADSNGCLPIHIAACYPVSLELLSMITNSYPPGCVVRAAGKDNSLPLHLAIENKLSLDSILIIFDTFREGCMVKNSMNRLPIHIATIEWCDHSPSIIQMLLKSYPRGCLERDSLEGLPLYYALHMKASSSSIYMLLNIYKQLGVDDDLRCLHIALQKKMNDRVVMRLLEAFPSAGVDVDEAGNMPLHSALLSGASEAIILSLIDQYPTSSYHIGENGSLPLHLAAEMKSSALIVKKILEINLEACRISNNEGDLPLHCAMKAGLPRSLVMNMFAAFPDACSVKNNDGDYPLHIALGSYRKIIAPGNIAIDDMLSKEDIDYIITSYPAAMEATSGVSGLYPIHLATRYDYPQDIIFMLIDMFPAGVRIKSSKGAYPFHFACVTENPSLSVLRRLHDSNPIACSTHLQSGKLPLHLVLQVKANASSAVDVIEFLLKVNPGASRHRDNDGNLPLHLAIRNQASLTAVLSLIGTYIQSTHEKTSDGSLPIHLAARYCSNVEVISDLLRFYPECSCIRDCDGDLPVHLAVRHNLNDDVIIYLIKDTFDLCGVEETGKSHRNMLQILTEAEAIFHIATERKISTRITSVILEATRTCMTSNAVFVDENLKQLTSETVNKGVVHVHDTQSTTMFDSGFYDEFYSNLVHIALRNNCSNEVLSTLISVKPSEVSNPYKFGGEKVTYMLHTAVKYATAVDIVHYLIDLNPHICLKKNHDNMTPLELAIDFSSCDIVSALLNAHPISSRGYLTGDKSDIIDENQMLPLHRALCKQSSLEVHRTLIQSFPEACSIKYKGVYPLHMAVTHRSPAEIVLWILKNNPEAANAIDSQGRLPLHLAIINQASFAIISALVTINPKGCKKYDQTEERYTPFDYCIKVETSAEVKKLLLLQDLPIQLDGTQHDQLPHCYTWTSFVDAANNVLAVNDMTEFIKFLFEYLRDNMHHPVSGFSLDPLRQSVKLYSDYNDSKDGFLINVLCNSTDRLGRTAIDIADDKVKEVMYQHLYFCGRYKLAPGPPFHSTRLSSIMYAYD